MLLENNIARTLGKENDKRMFPVSCKENVQRRLIISYFIKYRQIIHLKKQRLLYLKCQTVVAFSAVAALAALRRGLKRLKRFSQSFSEDLQTSTISVSPNWVEMCLLLMVHIPRYIAKSESRTLWFRCGNINKQLINLWLQHVKG